MDPDYDVTLDPDAGSSSSKAKSHFLDSLGFGEQALLAEMDEATPTVAEEDEGVILSSQPDDLDGPAAVAEPARGFSLSFSVTRGGAVPEAFAVPDAEEEALPEPEEDPAGSVPAPEILHEGEEPAMAEESLRLDCPECGGSLVLERRHLGIEGACVWCHTPIVAAASGRDGSVRIFPILGERAEAPLASPIPSREEPILPETEATFEMEKETCEIVEETAPPQTPTDEWTEPSRSLADPFPKMESGFVAPPDPLDLDALYQADGFVPPQEDAPSSHFDEEPLSAPVPAPEPEEEVIPMASFDGPSPWGPPSRPVAEPAQAASEPSGFQPSFLAPEETPSGFAASEPAEPAEPAPAAPSWETAFGTTQEAPSSLFPAMPPMEAMGAAPAGFRSAFGTGSATDPDTPPSAFSFGSLSADPIQDEPPGSTDGALSFGSFDAVSSPDRAEATTGSLFGNPDLHHSSSLPWGAPITDEAPEILPPSSGSDPVSAPVEAESAFAPIDFGGIGGTEPLVQAEAPSPTPSTFPSFASFSQIAAGSSPSPSAAAESAAPETPAGTTTAPTVVSQPLGTKPKPQVRKGFVVLMVVIVGFACGAALATFVLPVDRYVAATRAFLEAKLTPAPAVPVMPQMSALPGAPGGGGVEP